MTRHVLFQVAEIRTFKRRFRVDSSPRHSRSIPEREQQTDSAFNCKVDTVMSTT